MEFIAFHILVPYKGEGAMVQAHRQALPLSQFTASSGCRPCWLGAWSMEAGGDVPGGKTEERITQEFT